MVKKLSEYAKSMLTKRKITSYLLWLFVISISLLLGYQLGKTNRISETKELNYSILELLARQSDLPLKNIDLTRVEYMDTSYSPFDLETNILDYAYIQFNGTYIPTGKQFSLRHHINIYRTGYTPEITPTTIMYNDSIAHQGSVELVILDVLDDNSWGFCYTQSNTCFIESRYNDLLSRISVVLTDANEEQMSEILTLTMSTFYERVDASAIQSKSLIPASTLTALATTLTPSPTPTQVYGLLFSPDGTMRIQSPDWRYWEIIKEDGTILWSFSYDSNKYLKFGTDKVPFFSEAGYVPFYWSRDGKLVYLTCLHGGENSSTKFFGNAFVDGSGMFRFDVTTGEMTEIVPEIFPGYYAFSFSPDGKELVYANQTETPVRVKLLNLGTSEEKTIITGTGNILEIGALGWSPNQDKLIYSTLETNYDIFIIDLETLEKENIIKDFENHLSFENWKENDQVYYHDTYRVVWRLDLENETLAPLAVPTLTLSP